MKDKNKKSTEAFKKTIQAKIEEYAKEDSLFAERLERKDKNIDDCITYILNTVKQSGVMGCTDEEVFGMARHYYDEDKIDIGKPMKAFVVNNQPYVLSEEEKEEARKEALNQLIEKEKIRMSTKKKPKSQSVKTEETTKQKEKQQTLF